MILKISKTAPLTKSKSVETEIFPNARGFRNLAGKKSRNDD